MHKNGFSYRRLSRQQSRREAYREAIAELLTDVCAEDLGHRDSVFARCFGAWSARKLVGHFGPVFAKGIDERDCGIIFEDGAVVLINHAIDRGLLWRAAAYDG